MDEKTRLIHAGAATQALAKTVGPPVQRGSTVLMPNAAALYDHGRTSYGRQGLASHVALANALAELEGAEAVQLYPSGVAAMSAAMLAVLKSGDEVLCIDSIYLPTRTFCDTVLKNYGVSTRYFSPAVGPAAVLAQASDRTRLIILESPGSLTFDMPDVPAIASLAKSRGILTAIDNTWAAGLTFKPLAYGVDLSVQSLTKYVAGHSDVFMGSVALSDPALAARVRAHSKAMGWATSPDDAYQVLRGLRTLATRMTAQGAAGLKIADWLSRHSKVREVLHPALAGAPGYDLWRRDYTGAAGLFSVVLAPGGDIDSFLDQLDLFGLGYSWGGFESLIIPCDPQLGARVHHIDYGGPIVRLQIGLESPDDLMEDLARGLDVYAANGD